MSELHSDPGYWLYETSGVLRPAIEAYLAGGPMSAEHIAAMRAYLRQWINASVWDRNPYTGAGEKALLSQLRQRIDGLTTPEAIEAWVDDAIDVGLDPL